MQEQLGRVIARHAEDLEIVLVATMCLVQIRSEGRCFHEKQACFDALSELNKSDDLKDIRHLFHKLVLEWDCKTIKEFSVKISTELNTFSAAVKCKAHIEVKPDYILKS